MVRSSQFRAPGRIGALVTVIAIGLALGLTQPARAGTGAELAFDPASSSIAVDESVNVDITVADVSDLGGYDVFIQFDPSVVQMTSLTDSGFVTSGENIVVCNTPTIDNVAGTATNSCITVILVPPPAPGVSTVPPTPLMNATFEGAGPGISALTLTDTALQDPNAAPISATLGSGSISVSGTGAVGGITELPDVTSEAAGGAAEDSNGFSTLTLAVIVALLAVVAAGGFAIWRRSRAG